MSKNKLNITVSGGNARFDNIVQGDNGFSKDMIAKAGTIIGRRVFISYRRSDSADITGRIYDRLAKAFGDDNVFKDVISIPMGVNFRKHIQDILFKTNVLLAVIGKKWFGGIISPNRLYDDDDFVRFELNIARDLGILIIPLLVAGAKMPKKAELPDDLGFLLERSGLEIRPDPDFNNDMNRLIRDISLSQ
jgi:hypothetical protein